MRADLPTRQSPSSLSKLETTANLRWCFTASLGWSPPLMDPIRRSPHDRTSNRDKYPSCLVSSFIYSDVWKNIQKGFLSHILLSLLRRSPKHDAKWTFRYLPSLAIKERVRRATSPLNPSAFTSCPLAARSSQQPHQMFKLIAVLFASLVLASAAPIPQRNTVGFNTGGFNTVGFNTNGFNTNGFNTEGFNTKGFNTRRS